MSILDPIREDGADVIAAMQAKIDAAHATGGDSAPVTFTIGDLKALIAAIQQGIASMPASLPFGL